MLYQYSCCPMPYPASACFGSCLCPRCHIMGHVRVSMPIVGRALCSCIYGGEEWWCLLFFFFSAALFQLVHTRDVDGNMRSLSTYQYRPCQPTLAPPVQSSDCHVFNEKPGSVCVSQYGVHSTSFYFIFRLQLQCGLPGLHRHCLDTSMAAGFVRHPHLLRASYRGPQPWRPLYGTWSRVPRAPGATCS